MVNTLTMFQGFPQSSCFKGRKNIASSLIDSDSITKEVIQTFFEEFQVLVRHLQDQRNGGIKNLVREGKIKNPDTYKDEHPISPNKVYQALYLGKERYPHLLRLFKLFMLIPPSTANVERRFSVLALLSTKQRNRLKPENLAKLMGLILIG